MTFAGIGLVTLPNPELGDTEALNVGVTSRQAMDSTRYTYVKSNADHSFSYDFDVDIQKLFQLQQFIRDNVGQKFSITDHNDVQRDVYFSNTPISFSDDAFASVGTRNEFGTVTIEVIGA